MAQSGKVLHLYVEVRSVPDEEGKELGNIEGPKSLMLQGPDILPQSQHGAPNAPHGLMPPAGVLHKGASSTQSLTSNKSPSRHSVSFQLHPGDKPAHPSTRHRQSLPYDEMSKLLSAFQPGPNGSPCTLVRTRSSESEPLFERDSRFPGHFTAPPTPSGIRRAYGREDEGKRSVVTYSYIEKSHIKSLEGHRSPLCQREPVNPFRRANDDQAVPLHLRKRLSDPVWFNGSESTSSPNPKHALPGSVSTPRGTPNLRRATLDTIAKEATLRALEEFGSPQLKRRLAANSPEGGHDFMHREQPRCRSWSGSPMVSRSTRTLPTYAQIINSEQQRTLHGIPRSPATDHLSAHARQPYYTKSPTINARSQENPSQRVWKGDESPRQGCRNGPPLPSCRPTAIQHEIPSMTITEAPCEQKHSTSESPRQPQKVNFNLSNSSNLSDAGGTKVSGRKSTSPATSPEMARKLAEEATKLSILMEARRSPSPTPSLSDTVRSDSPRSGRSSRESQQLYASFQGSAARTSLDSDLPAQMRHWEEDPIQTGHQSGLTSPFLSHRGNTSPALPSMLHRLDLVSTSPIRDPQQERAELSRKDSPVLYRHRPPQYMGDNWSLGLEHRHYDAWYDSGLRDSPDSNRRHCLTNNSVSLTSQQQHWREGHSSGVRKESNKGTLYDPGAPLDTSSRELSKQTRIDPAVLDSQENNFRVPAHKEILGEGRSDGEQSSALSQMSSGVTGSLEQGLHEGDCISPETFSQTSQKSSNAGNMGIQLESGSSLLGPSLHSQKIARAKWEFLFGKPSEDHHGVKGSPSTAGTKQGTVSSTAPSSGYSSDSLTPATASSLPLRSTAAPSRHRPTSESQKASSHDVQQVDVELVNTAPALGSSPKTGIIRRTIKYSETDLDAVPLRCYRETDIDEVILAEQEEVDSAFSSDRSALGTSAASSSPNVEEDEQLQDEEVVSWASVRMHGDRKRQHAAQEGDEVFSLLLKGSPNVPSDSHTALKSPINVGSPRRTSVDGLDSFSRHFESIMESHRAKGTSYSSLDSVDMTPTGPPIFTFDLPTLTPEIQSQICESAQQIIELSFAPLARPEAPSLSGPSASEVMHGQTGTGQSSTSEEESESSSSGHSDSHILPASDSDTAVRSVTIWYATHRTVEV
ncbi:hypothetical protein SRHO_G00046900 [Serrasalmus rhombeus]